MAHSLPIIQIAFAVIDLRRTDTWWREGLGLLPVGGNRTLMRGPKASRLQNIDGLAMTVWWLAGRNESAQLALYQYESPVSKLMPDDYRACDLGYSRCGVWVGDFDAALQRLASLGTLPLSPPVGPHGQRRVCVRNPDGVFVELMEDDPLPAQNHEGRRTAPAAIRSVTLSTPDLAASVGYFCGGLGMSTHDKPLHDSEHEALWELEGAHCHRQVLTSGHGGSSILLEVVEYQKPAARPFPPNYRLCDQRIINISLGDPQRFDGISATLAQAEGAGARCLSAPVTIGPAECVYLTDPLGFSQEICSAKYGSAPRSADLARSEAGSRPAPDDRSVSAEVCVSAPAAAVFAVLSDHAGLSDWAGLGEVRLDQPGHPDPAGRHAERVIAGPFGALREQITEVEPDRRCRYRIIEGGPFVGHWGDLELSPVAGGTRVRWTIRFRSRVPALGGLFAFMLGRKLPKVLKALQQRVKQGPLEWNGRPPRPERVRAEQPR
jgi:catechol 2,3-dioxygenase-like lactoylglutathione lyase family enzyme